MEYHELVKYIHPVRFWRKCVTILYLTIPSVHKNIAWCTCSRGLNQIETEKGGLEKAHTRTIILRSISNFAFKLGKYSIHCQHISKLWLFMELRCYAPNLGRPRPRWFFHKISRLAWPQWWSFVNVDEQGFLLKNWNFFSFFDLTFNDFQWLGRQKVPKSDFQSQFSSLTITQIFPIFLLTNIC